MREVKKLAAASYKNGILNQGLVERIIKLLKPKEIKQYIKTLKNIENKNTVLVTFADKEVMKEIPVMTVINKLFKGRIKINEDKALIAGIKIVDYDMVYDLSLKEKIEKMKNFMVK